MEAYQAWADEVRPLVGPEIQDGFAFHDSQVTAVERTEDRLTLFLEPGGYSEVRRVDFLGARVNLQCRVKTKEAWKNSEAQLRNFGFR